MGSSIDVSLLDHPFAEQIDGIRRLLGMPDNPTLFPGHFLKATFPKIGGMVVRLRTDDGAGGVGFLFPRALTDRGRRFTLRLHRLSPRFDFPPDEIGTAVGRHIRAGVTCYEPMSTDVTYAPEISAGTGLQIGRPGELDARAVRELQRRIWNPDSPDALYPVDLHSRQFCPGTSLIAKVDGVPAGFLFGFFKFGGKRLPSALAARYPDGFRLESQLMGVLPSHRSSGVSVALKLRQAELARRDGIHVVNWTFDPLQYVNAILNFRRLRGVAFDFSPNYYQFSNELNQAPASRLSVTWLISSAAVRGSSAELRPDRVDVGAIPGIVRLNSGPDRIASPGGARCIAIEIPADWTGLQRDRAQREVVLRWRATTDEILGECLGPGDGQYALTGAGRDGDGRCYLVGERVDEELLARIGD